MKKFGEGHKGKVMFADIQLQGADLVEPEFCTDKWWVYSEPREWRGHVGMLSGSPVFLHCTPLPTACLGEIAFQFESS